MKLLTILILFNSSLWAKNEFAVQKVYFEYQGRLQYGAIRLQTNPPQPTPEKVVVSYERYIGKWEANRTRGSVRDIPYKDLAFETDSMNLQIGDKQKVLKKDEVVMGEDGKFYLVQGTFGNNGKVALLELKVNPNQRGSEPLYFSKKNNINIFDASFIKAFSVQQFSTYEVGKEYDKIGSQTYCEYLKLQAIEKGKERGGNCRNPNRVAKVNYIFSDGTLIVNEMTIMNLPRLLERYLPPSDDGRSVQGK